MLAVGTHGDLLDAMLDAERQKMLDHYLSVTGGNIFIVSTSNGTGLTDFVVALFQALPDTVSPSKLQESLTNESKLSRLSFVLGELSGTLADVALLKGNQSDEIRITSLYMFASLCKHYSVDEATWLSYHGNIAELAKRTEKEGFRTSTQLRDPKTIWEQIQSLFGTTFTVYVRDVDRIGIGGISVLLPKAYDLIYEFSQCKARKLTQVDFTHMLSKREANIDAGVAKTDREVIVRELRAMLSEMLGGSA